MKPQFFLFYLIISATYFQLAHASEPYWKRNCRLAGGLYWALSLDRADGSVLCRFGDAALSAESLALYRVEGISSQAVRGYQDGLSCRAAGAQLQVETDTEGQRFTLCVFPDHSYIEYGTLLRGPDHPANAGLTRALLR